METIHCCETGYFSLLSQNLWYSSNLWLQKEVAIWFMVYPEFVSQYLTKWATKDATFD
jgi:hypothetical protein